MVVGIKKPERISLRVSPATKALIAHAALIAADGDITEFVVEAARERAQRVLADHEFTTIHAGNRERFYSLLLHPPTPSAALRSLFADETPFKLVD